MVPRCSRRRWGGAPAEVGATFVARNAEDEVAEELRVIKPDDRPRGRGARSGRGETLLVDGGECSRGFAEALRAAGTEVSVYTNALAILDILAGAPAVRVFLTAGEYQAATRTLVGPSVGSLLETIRVDRAIVSPDGISRGFGLSFDDERAALVCRRFCEVAREVVVLADHGVGRARGQGAGGARRTGCTRWSPTPARSRRTGSSSPAAGPAGHRGRRGGSRAGRASAPLQRRLSDNKPEGRKNMTIQLSRIAAIVAVGLLGSAAAGQAQQVTLKFWDNQQTESGLSQFQQEAVKRFEAENPDIKVEVTTIPYPEYQQKLLTAVQSGNGPDVSTVDQIWNAAFAEAGAVREPRRDGQRLRREGGRLLPRRLGIGQLQGRALGRAVQRRRLVLRLHQQRALQGGGRRSGIDHHLGGPRGSRSEADRRQQGPLSSSASPATRANTRW